MSGMMVLRTCKDGSIHLSDLRKAMWDVSAAHLGAVAAAYQTRAFDLGDLGPDYAKPCLKYWSMVVKFELLQRERQAWEDLMRSVNADPWPEDASV